MRYAFPEIRTIDDVLPHVEGREEFIVAERDFGTVINYAVAMTNTFDMTGSDDLGVVLFLLQAPASRARPSPRTGRRRVCTIASLRLIAVD